MRLASLARKLQVKPSELREFLTTENIPLPSDSNTKLDEDIVELVYNHFAPELIETSDLHPVSTSVEAVNDDLPNPTEEQEIDQSISDVEIKKEAQPKEWSDELEPTILPLAEGEANQETDTEIEEEEPVEVIKAPKITLPGLTIKGKINLPEPKPKKEEEEEEKPQKQRPQRGRKENRKGSRRSDDYNPLAEERKRKAREDEKRRKREAEKKKEQRRKRYEENVRTRVNPPKPSQPKVEKVDSDPKSTIPKAQEKRSGLARFWKWLNS